LLNEYFIGQPNMKISSWKILLNMCGSTYHQRLVACGLLALGLGYFPLRIIDLAIRSFQGSQSSVMLMLAVVGAYRLWKERQKLTFLQANPEDRWIGSVLIVAGMVAFVMSWPSDWLLTFSSFIILFGIFCGCWGMKFFKEHLLSVIVIFVGLIPHPTTVARTLVPVFIPSLLLERWTAWLGYLGLRVIGQTAALRDNIIILPGGSVQVDWSCTAFGLAGMVAIAGWLAGLFFNINWLAVVKLVIAGICLAFLINIPRIMLLAIAKAYWSEAMFESWHHGLCSQIITGILFTMYYYLIMEVANRQKNLKNS
jgi:exosortase/archaeosortase family protein